MGRFSLSQIVFRGLLMRPEWIADWSQKQGHIVNLPGCISTTRSVEMGLRYSYCHDKSRVGDEKSVLVVILLQNHIGFRGFRLNQPKYTPYPYEQEYLMMEGFEVKILNVDRDVSIDNGNVDVFDGGVVTIIYCYY